MTRMLGTVDRQPLMSPVQNRNVPQERKGRHFEYNAE